MATLSHFTATLTATGTNLAALLGLTPAQDIPFQSLSIQADGANTGPVFIGGPGVTTTDYLVRIPVASGGVPGAPSIWEAFGRPVHLSEVYVVGTLGEKVHVGGFGW